MLHNVPSRCLARLFSPNLLLTSEPGRPPLAHPSFEEDLRFYDGVRGSSCAHGGSSRGTSTLSLASLSFVFVEEASRIGRRWKMPSRSRNQIQSRASQRKSRYRYRCRYPRMMMSCECRGESVQSIVTGQCIRTRICIYADTHEEDLRLCFLSFFLLSSNNR